MSTNGTSVGTPSRSKLRAVIPRRMKVGPLTALVLAFAFALALTPIIRIDLWLSSSGQLDVKAGVPSPVTVRVPPFADPAPGGGAIVVARGDVPTAQTAAVVTAVRARTPHGLFGDLAYFAVVLTLTAIYTMQLRRSNRGRFLRTQVVLLGTLLVVAAIVKTLMLTTAMSVLAVPVALLALSTAIALDRDAGVATGVLSSVVVGLLVPFDIGVTAILLVQALTASLLLPDRIRRRWQTALFSGAGAALTSLLAYGVVHYLTRGTAPTDELERLGASSWVAAAAGGLVAALAAVPMVPLIQVLCGEITDGALIALEDLSHPLLKQISEKSPGTWQHSLAMANMAEIAANAIGANGRLVRVGAYFHDLGKSLQPKYFIENVESGEQSPHDRLPPEVSCDAIFAHVTEGIALAKRQRLPDRIIDFMHMHHGDGVLEYFWAKCQEQGNPNHLTSEDFRYPGVPPQSRETAILAICDAVEAASRTLRRPDQQAISSLVQRIVYGKLHLGQLDESGLSMADLRKINDSLRETIKHAHHGRIEYPWQRAEREAEAKEQATVHEKPRQRDSITQRIMDEPRLDSLDAPRPPWASGGTGPNRAGRTSSPGFDPADGAAATMPVPAQGTDPTMSLRPRTYADSVDVAHAATAQQAAMVTTDTGSVRIAHDPVPVPAPVPVPDPAPAIEAAIDAQLVSEPVSLPPAQVIEPVVAEKPRWSGTFAAAAADAIETVKPPPPPPATKWGSRLADRIDEMLETAPEDAAVEAAPAPEPEPAPEPISAEPSEPLIEISTAEPSGAAEPVTTVRRAPPPPPGRPRRARSTQDVEDDIVEAQIELSPSVKGPPPATRQAAPASRAASDADTFAGQDDEVTVVPTRPPSSVMPPRARTHGKPRE